MNLKHFLKECSNKNVFKMISIYLVSTWILLQVLAVTGNAIGLPTITMTYVIVFLLLGFPIKQLKSVQLVKLQMPYF